MANLKEVRTRIASVNSTMQMTSAMKMVAASKLRKSQSAIIALRPYASKMREIMCDLSSSMGNSGQGVYAENRQVNRILVVPVASNKGLCGIFNANVIRATQHLIDEDYRDYKESGNIDVFCIGSKAEEVLRSRKYNVVGSRNELLDGVTYDKATAFAEELMKTFVDKKYDKILFIYNQFKNAGSQTLVNEQYLPISVDDDKSASCHDDDKYIFQPDKVQILDTLTPKSLRMQVYKVLLDSFTSEQGSRMVAMTKATDNAVELLKELNVMYNKARQGAITNELVEIVSGANALNG